MVHRRPPVIVSYNCFNNRSLLQPSFLQTTLPPSFFILLHHNGYPHDLYTISLNAVIILSATCTHIFSKFSPPYCWAAAVAATQLLLRFTWIFHIWMFFLHAVCVNQCHATHMRYVCDFYVLLTHILAPSAAAGIELNVAKRKCEKRNVIRRWSEGLRCVRLKGEFECRVLNLWHSHLTELISYGCPVRIGWTYFF